MSGLISGRSRISVVGRDCCPSRWTTPVQSEQLWNVGPAHRRHQTALDDLPKPTITRLGVRVPLNVPSSVAGSDLGTCLCTLRTTANYSNADCREGFIGGSLVALVLVMAEPVAQPPECVPGTLSGT